MKTFLPTIVAVAMLGPQAVPASAESADQRASAALLSEAQHHFYSGRYEAAAALALEARLADPGNLAAFELRSSALLFQIKRTFGNPEDRDDAWKACAVCQELLSAFLTETALGQTAARARLAASGTDESALFFLGKLDLNYIWLHLGTLGKKAGWSEYWEARKSLDKVLEANPNHVRARVARGWIDYIVDTRVPWGTKWLLGGGSRERGLEAVQEAAIMQSEPFAQAEAMFALWDMQVREKNLTAALVTAQALARDFPDNRELARFIDAQATGALSDLDISGCRAESAVPPRAPRATRHEDALPCGGTR